jgi:hypothetical protein
MKRARSLIGVFNIPEPIWKALFVSYGRLDPIRAENETTNTYNSNEWPMYSCSLPKPEGTIMKFNELS